MLCTPVSTGGEAIGSVESLQPDVVLLDLGMPGIDGYETARRLRALPWGSQGRIIALSGYGQEADKRLTQAVGFDGHLVKPLQMESFSKLVAPWFSAPHPPAPSVIVPPPADDRRQLAHDLRGSLSILSMAVTELGCSPAEAEQQELLGMLGRHVALIQQGLTDLLG